MKKLKWQTLKGNFTAIGVIDEYSFIKVGDKSIDGITVCFKDLEIIMGNRSMRISHAWLLLKDMVEFSRDFTIGSVLKFRTSKRKYLKSSMFSKYVKFGLNYGSKFELKEIGNGKSLNEFIREELE